MKIITVVITVLATCLVAFVVLYIIGLVREHQAQALTQEWFDANRQKYDPKLYPFKWSIFIDQLLKLGPDIPIYGDDQKCYDEDLRRSLDDLLSIPASCHPVLHYSFAYNGLGNVFKTWVRFCYLNDGAYWVVHWENDRPKIVPFHRFERDYELLKDYNYTKDQILDFIQHGKV